MCKVNQKKYPRYVAGLFLIVFVSISISISISIDKYDSKRIYNLRKVPPEYRISLLNTFFENTYKKDNVLLIGDSQANGHMFPTEYIFSSLLENKSNIQVLNFAFQDARIKDNIYVLEYAKNKNSKFNAIVFNANQSHVKVNDFTRLDFNKTSDYQYGVLKEMKSFIDFMLHPNVSTKPNEKLKLTKYDNYFDMDTEKLNEYEEKLEKLINIAKKLTSKVIIYITPHPVEAILYDNKDNVEKLKLFSSAIKSVCIKHNVICVEPDIQDSEYFFDIVHFNSKGHEKMYLELLPLLK